MLNAVLTRSMSAFQVAKCIIIFLYYCTSAYLYISDRLASLHPCINSCNFYKHSRCMSKTCMDKTCINLKIFSCLKIMGHARWFCAIRVSYYIFIDAIECSITKRIYVFGECSQYYAITFPLTNFPHWSNCWCRVKGENLSGFFGTF